MKRCPISYEPIEDSARYSQKGLKLLFRGLTDLAIFPYSAEEQRLQAATRAIKMSIQGVQPKISAVLDTKNREFIIVDTGGQYILKPQSNLYKNLPENEDVTMRLARVAGIEIALHGLLFSQDDSLTYFVKRFDRSGKHKVAVEDFAQLSGRTRETKYDSSMEQVAKILDAFCTFPVIEKTSLFRRTIFNYLIGNEDMHLKNFSLIRRNGKVELSPAYDLVNTTIALPHVEEEIALPIRGKKKNLTSGILIGYFGNERLKLTKKSIEEILQTFSASKKEWEHLILNCFLSETAKNEYNAIMNQRFTVLGL